MIFDNLSAPRFSVPLICSNYVWFMVWVGLCVIHSWFGLCARRRRIGYTITYLGLLGNHTLKTNQSHSEEKAITP